MKGCVSVLWLSLIHICHLVSPAGYANNKEAYEGDRAAKVPALRDIYQRYWERCRQADAMDFDAPGIVVAGQYPFDRNKGKHKQ